MTARPLIVVGQGKLAAELRAGLPQAGCGPLLDWPLASTLDRDGASPPIVIHAGSGRERAALIDWCRQHAAPLVELSTDSEWPAGEPAFPLLICPNVNLMMLRFMALVRAAGPLFHDCQITLTESHQASKTSLPGTARQLAQALGLPPGRIVSLREPAAQRAFGVPAAALARHAVHRIDIEGEGVHLRLESRVFGAAPYAAGLARLLKAWTARPLAHRRYSVMELIDAGGL